MSLILDALRKSEAERRRGQAPSLYAQSPVPTTRMRPAWLPLLGIAVGVLLMLAAVVFWLRDDGPASKEELVEEADAPSLVPEAATLDGAPAVAPPPPVSTPPPIVATPPAPAANGAASAPPPAGVDALVKPPPNAPPPSAITRIPAAESAAPPAPAEDAVPPVAVLDPSTRSGLPPMKLSMHVYNDDPARRFAIIDGQRVSEGSQIGAAIVLSIRRDGVVLDVAGRRVLLAKP